MASSTRSGKYPLASISSRRLRRVSNRMRFHPAMRRRTPSAATQSTARRGVAVIGGGSDVDLRAQHRQAGHRGDAGMQGQARRPAAGRRPAGPLGAASPAPPRRPPRAAVPAEQHRGRLQVAHHAGRVGGGQRRHPVDDVAEQLAGDPVQPEGDDRPEGGVLPARHDQRAPRAAPSSARRGRPPRDPARSREAQTGDQLRQVAPGVRHLLGVVEVAMDAGLVGPPAQRLGRCLRAPRSSPAVPRPRRLRPGCAPDTWARARSRTRPAAPPSRPPSATPPWRFAGQHPVDQPAAGLARRCPAAAPRRDHVPASGRTRSRADSA